MKKNYLWTILAGVALASCVSNDEVEQSVLQKQELTFGNPVLNSQTKAVTGEITGTTYPTNENFIVWGVETDGNFAGWGADNIKSNFFGSNGVVVTNDGYSDGHWHIYYTDADAEKYYWPAEASHKLTFAACSPARITSHATVSYGATGLQLLDYTMPAEPNDHFDLMYSPRALNVTQSPVTISFSHALSSIVFYTQKPEVAQGGAHSVKVTDITLKGDIQNKGTFQYKYDETSTSATGSEVWINRSTTNPSATYDLLNEPFEVTTSLTPIAKIKPFLAIPQTVESDMKFSITYQIVQHDGDNAVEFTEEFSFTDFLLANSNTYTPSWDRGNRYRYVINFGAMKEITFSPVISADWKDTDAGAIEISTSAMGGVVAP